MADTRLTPSELSTILLSTIKTNWLEHKEKITIHDWLNDKHSPSDEALDNWGDVIRSVATHIPKSSKNSLAELGVEVV